MDQIVSDISETKTFEYKIQCNFSDLTDNFEERIFKKLSEQDFFNTVFDVINIINFKVKEMKVVENFIDCLLKITVVCNNPEIGKIIKINNNFKINKTSLIYSKGRIQIIASLPTNIDIKNEYYIKIESVKTLVKNILCVGTIVDI